MGDEAELPQVRDVSDQARREFESFFQPIPYSKDLVIQSTSLMSLLEHITPMKILRSLQIDHIYLLEPSMTTGGLIRFYLTRPEITAMNYIVDHIKYDYKQKEKRKYYIIFVPRVLASCEYILEREGVIGQVQILNWTVNLIPLDEHVLSLEYPNTARTLLLDGNYSVLHSVATSLLLLEEQFGTIPKIHGKGKFSSMVYEMFTRMKEALGKDTFVKSNGDMDISEVVLFDRTCDLITPMCSQLTYEGMLDDVFKIHCGFVELDKDITGKGKVKVLLNEKDPVFSLIRSMHFSAVSEVLIEVSKELQRKYIEGRDRGKTIQEMKEFIKKLPSLKEKHESLSFHLKASEQIIRQKKEKDFQRQLNTEWILLEGTDKQSAYDFIEESIQCQSNIYVPLQLLCLASTTSDGIKSKYYHQFKREFLQSYGHKHMVTYHNLTKAGLIKEKIREDLPGKSLIKDETASFSQLSRLLQLVPKDPAKYDLRQPTDPSYVFGGAYIPLSCAAICHLIGKGKWQGIEDVIRNWEGPYFSKDQASSSKHATGAKTKFVVVYFIGGVTFSEINALRFMGSQLNCSFIIATTDIVNWKSLLDSFMQLEVSITS